MNTKMIKTTFLAMAMALQMGQIGPATEVKKENG
jgi:hypothetical protein